MSKKIKLTQDQINMCLKMYNEDLFGSTTISKKMGIHKTIIIRTLKENGIVFGPSGRRFIGGKSASDKRNYHKHKDKKSQNYKKWREDNREYIKEKHTEWRQKNREHVNKYAREYERKKCIKDPKYKLGKNTRTAVYTCLKERNVSKYRSTFELLGYTIDELMQHLENQFTDGMSWFNYGQWHVDHIKPMSSFNFTSITDPEFKECWSLSNLQPLWSFDNLSKGSKILNGIS